jgi:hypothetical protein
VPKRKDSVFSPLLSGGNIALIFFFIGVGAACFLAAPYDLSFPVTWHHSDEGFILYKSYLVSIGKLPYVDFDPFWPPGVYLLNGLLFKLFDANLLVAKYGLAVVTFLSSLFLFMIAAKLMPKYLAALCALLFVFWGPPVLNIPYSSWYSVPLGLGGLYAVSWGIEKEKLIPIFVAGAAAGAAFSFKQSIGVFVLASYGLMGLFWRRREFRHNSIGMAAEYLLILILCIGLPAAYVSRHTVSNSVLLHFPAFLLAGLLVWTVSMFRRQARSQLRVRNLLLYQSLLAGGFAAAILPWFLYLGPKTGWLELFRNVLLIGQSWRIKEMIVPFPPFAVSSLIFPAILTAGASFLFMVLKKRENKTELLLCLSAIAILLALGLNSIVEGTAVRYFFSSRWDSNIFLYLPLPAIIAYAIFLVTNIKKGTGADRHLISICLSIYCVLLLQQTFPYEDLNHFSFSFAPWIPLCFFLVYRACHAGMSRNGKLPVWRQRAIILAFALPLSFFLMARATNQARLFLAVKQSAKGWSLERRTLSRLDVKGGEMLFDSGYSQMFKALVDHIEENTRPTDTVAALPSLAIVNFFTRRQAPTKFLYLWPGYFSVDEIRRTAQEIREKQPRYIIVSNMPALPNDILSYAGYEAQYPEIAKVVSDLYVPEATIGFFTVLRPKKGTGTNL